MARPRRNTATAVAKADTAETVQAVKKESAVCAAEEKGTVSAAAQLSLIHILIGYYRDIGLEAYMAHDFDEYNRLLTYLQVRKAVANTKILILSNTEQTPASVNTSCCDLVKLFTRYGIRNNRIDFRQVFKYFDEIQADESLHQEARALLDLSRIHI